MPTAKGIINIDFDVSINPGKKYWIVIEDTNADKNNYHRFKYTTNINDNQLYINNEPDGNISLSFSIDGTSSLLEYYELPTTLEIYNNDFKIHQNFYRYNIKTSSNVYLKNFTSKTGYRYGYELPEEDEEDED